MLDCDMQGSIGPSGEQGARGRNGNGVSCMYVYSILNNYVMKSIVILRDFVCDGSVCV